MKIQILTRVKILFLPGILFCHVSNESADQVLDVLNASTIPAFILMGVSSTEISRPTNISDFTSSLQNATNELNSLPVNYAIEFLLDKEDDKASKENDLVRM